MLSDEQILELYAYCNRKGIHYYDIQVEIVDHMANAIEAKMLTNPNMEFKQALEEVHISFGSFGLREIVREKTNVMGKHYRKMRMQLFISYFKPPKLMLTLLLVIAMISFEKLLTIEFLPYVFLGGLIATFVVFVRFAWLRRALRKQQKQQLLMTDKQYFVYSFPYFIVFSQIVPRFFRSDFFNTLNGGIGVKVEYYIYTSFLILYALGSLSLFELVKTVTAKARKQFPVVFAK